MKRQLVAASMIVTMALAILGSAVATATPTDGLLQKTMKWEGQSLDFYGAQVVYSKGMISFTQSADPKSSKLATTASTGEIVASQGTNMAYLGANWKLSDADWKNLKDKPVVVTATVSYKLVGGGTGRYGSSSSTVLLGAGSDPTKPIKAVVIASSASTLSALSRPYQRSGGTTGYMGPTTLNQLKTTDGAGTIWVALQTHIVSGIAGETTASGDVTVQSIQLTWTC